MTGKNPGKVQKALPAGRSDRGQTPLQRCHEGLQIIWAHMIARVLARAPSTKRRARARHGTRSVHGRCSKPRGTRGIVRLGCGWASHAWMGESCMDQAQQNVTAHRPTAKRTSLAPADQAAILQFEHAPRYIEHESARQHVEGDRSGHMVTQTEQEHNETGRRCRHVLPAEDLAGRRRDGLGTRLSPSSKGMDGGDSDEYRI